MKLKEIASLASPMYMAAQGGHLEIYKLHDDGVIIDGMTMKNKLSNGTVEIMMNS